MNYSAKLAELMNQFPMPYKRTETERIAQGVVLGVFFVIPFIANATICTVLIQGQRLKSVSNLLLLSLISANLLLTLSNVPFSLISVVLDRWFFGDLWCEVIGFSTNSLTTASNFSIIAIAVHRYYLVVKPLSVKIDLPRAKLLVAYVWFSAIICCTPPLIGWNNYEYSPGKGYCTVSWGEGGPGLVYSLFLVSASYVTPLLSMMYVYWAIYKATQAQRKRTDRNTIKGLANGYSRQHFAQASFQSLRGSYLCGCIPKSNNDQEFNDRQRRHISLAHATSLSLSIASSSFSQRDPFRRPERKSVNRSKRKITLMPSSIYEIKTIQNATLLIISFLLCLTPYFVVNLWTGFSQTTPSHVTDFVTSWLHMSMTVVNPVVYGYLNRHIKRAIRKLPVCKCLRTCRKRNSRGAAGVDSSRAYQEGPVSWAISNDGISVDVEF